MSFPKYDKINQEMLTAFARVAALLLGNQELNPNKAIRQASYITQLGISTADMRHHLGITRLLTTDEISVFFEMGSSFLDRQEITIVPSSPLSSDDLDFLYTIIRDITLRREHYVIDASAETVRIGRIDVYNSITIFPIPPFSLDDSCSGAVGPLTPPNTPLIAARKPTCPNIKRIRLMSREADDDEVVDETKNKEDEEVMLVPLPNVPHEVAKPDDDDESDGDCDDDASAASEHKDDASDSEGFVDIKAPSGKRALDKVDSDSEAAPMEDDEDGDDVSETEECKCLCNSEAIYQHREEYTRTAEMILRLWKRDHRTVNFQRGLSPFSHISLPHTELPYLESVIACLEYNDPIIPASLKQDPRSIIFKEYNYFDRHNINSRKNREHAENLTSYVMSKIAMYSTFMIPLTQMTPFYTLDCSIEEQSIVDRFNYFRHMVQCNVVGKNIAHPKS